MQLLYQQESGVWGETKHRAKRCRVLRLVSYPDGCKRESHGSARLRPGWRVFSNLHNSGVASVTTGLLFAGILEIAGTGSEITYWFFIIGALFIVCGFVALRK
jgi:hypothetical protein